MLKTAKKACKAFCALVQPEGEFAETADIFGRDKGFPKP